MKTFVRSLPNVVTRHSPLHFESTEIFSGIHTIQRIDVPNDDHTIRDRSKSGKDVSIENYLKRILVRILFRYTNTNSAAFSAIQLI